VKKVLPERETDCSGSYPKINRQRFIDKAPYSFDYYHVLRTKGIWLVCSDCHHIAVLQEKENGLLLTCQTCFKTEKIEEHANKTYYYRYTGICQKCGKYIRYDLAESTHPIVTKACTNCGEPNLLNLEKSDPVSSQYKKINFLKNGLDPLTGKQLYFLDTFKGQAFWALNLAHLNYLIEYVAAELRERDENIYVWKTAGHTIPKFVKASKNRKTILRKLNKMKRSIL
jgi:hypothetical protein